MIPADKAPIVDKPISPTGALAKSTKPHRSRRKIVLIGLAILVVGAVIAGVRFATAPAAPPPVATPVPAPKYTAHGVVRPIAEAKVGTIAGGTVSQISVGVGTAVESGQEVARVRGPDGTTEIITAPWRGTVADVLAQVGDTVIPGSTIAIVDDLSQLKVETTDVDEFLLPHVHVGQTVTMSVEALDGREIEGQVRTVGIEPRQTTTGDSYYPVTIALSGSTDGLKPGMTTDITFPS